MLKESRDLRFELPDLYEKGSSLWSTIKGNGLENSLVKSLKKVLEGNL